MDAVGLVESFAPAPTPPVDFPPAGPDSCWMVAHTRPRCEKKLAAQLTSERLPHFLPLVPTVHRYADGTKRFLKPLFPGYVFTLVPHRLRPQLFTRQHVARLIAVERGEALFLRQLTQVRTVLASGYEVSPQPLLSCGARVRITSGPLFGVEGIVLRTDRLTSIVVAIDVLQLGARVTVPASVLAPAA